MKKLNNFFQRRYRIVTDNYHGFEVQSLVWYFPFWLECDCDNGGNSHYSIERAKEYMNRQIANVKFKSKVVYP